MQREISFGRKKRIKLKDLAVFARQFATMIDAGLTMLRALTILAEQSENPELRRILRGVKQDVEAGLSLSAAFGKTPEVFPALMVNMTRAGEAGGFLDVTMRQIADNFEAEVKLRGKIKAAMTYPTVVFVLAILMCIGMLVFVVPVFEGMFADLGGELPLPTKVLVFLSSAMRFLLPAFAVAGVAFVWWWRKFGKTERVRNVVDPLKLRLPVFGNLFAKLALARFARNLSTLLSSGVPILQSLDIVSETTGSIVISRALKEVQESVRRGESVAGPLAEHEVFPPMVVQMIASGEESGAIDQMLGKIAQFYD
jgi:type IV pilus assembly protein PilC